MKKITFLIALLVANFSFGQIVITEIMFNPAESGTDTTEYIELYNAGSSSVDLTGYKFTEGVVHEFSSGTIPAGEYFVIAVNSVELDNRYGDGTADAQWTSGSLSNGGEDIQLEDANGIVVDYVDYDDSKTSWYGADTDQGGASLTLCDPSSDNNLSTSWSASTTIIKDENNADLIVNTIIVKGTPGAQAACSTLSISAVDSKSLYVSSSNGVVTSNRGEIFAVYNTLGQKVANANLQGVYIVRVQDGAQVKAVKVLVQ